MTSQERYERQHISGARAVGLIVAMLNADRFPPAYADMAREIVASWPEPEPDKRAEAAEAATRG